MAPENVLVVYLKLQMQLDVDFFVKLLKNYQAKEICKKSQNLLFISRIDRQLLHESPNHVYRNRKTAPALPAKHKNMGIDCVKKKVTLTK